MESFRKRRFGILESMSFVDDEKSDVESRELVNMISYAFESSDDWKFKRSFSSETLRKVWNEEVAHERRHSLVGTSGASSVSAPYFLRRLRHRNNPTIHSYSSSVFRNRMKRSESYETHNLELPLPVVSNRSRASDQAGRSEF